MQTPGVGVGHGQPGAIPAVAVAVGEADRSLSDLLGDLQWRLQGPRAGSDHDLVAIGEAQARRFGRFIHSVQRSLPFMSRGTLCIQELLSRSCRRPISTSSPVVGAAPKLVSTRWRSASIGAGACRIFLPLVKSRRGAGRAAAAPGRSSGRPARAPGGTAPCGTDAAVPVGTEPEGEGDQPPRGEPPQERGLHPMESGPEPATPRDAGCQLKQDLPALPACFLSRGRRAGGGESGRAGACCGVGLRGAGDLGVAEVRPAAWVRRPGVIVPGAGA
jgi:hypothetical protein